MIRSEPRDLYLDLIKKTLSYALWPEPPLPIGSRSVRGPYRVTRAFGRLSRLLGGLGIQVVRTRTIAPEQRLSGGFWPA